jgi:replication fork protection complex subunit Tof1/Swi1
VKLTVDDPDAVWMVPATVTANDLEINLRLLKQYIDDPPFFEDGKSGADLLRRIVVRKDYSESDKSGSDSSESEASGKPRKPSKKRNRRAVGDAELQARREKRRLADLEKRAMIKSSLRILDSDSDSDADREFFEREKELRERMARKALEGDLPSSGTRKIGAKKKRAVEKQRHVVEVESEMDGIIDFEMVELANDRSRTPVSTDPVQDDQSENGELDGVRPAKKQKMRAVSLSSDEE